MVDLVGITSSASKIHRAVAIAAVIVSIAGGRASAQSPGDVLARDYFRAALQAEAVNDVAIPEGATLFLGDSITANMAVDRIVPGAFNFGLAGDTTPGILYRFRNLRSVHRAGALVLQGGVNDLGFGRQFDTAIVRNYRLMIREAPRRTRLVVIGILPVDEHMNREFTGYNQRSRTINASIRKACGVRPGCVFVDASAALRVAKGRGSLFRDGVHLSMAGNEVLYAALSQALNPPKASENVSLINSSGK